MIRNCLICHKEFHPTNQQVELGRGKYCSRKCDLESRKMEVETRCLYCNKTFTTVPSLLKIGKSKYCSIKCAIKCRPKLPYKRTGENRRCLICGKEYYVIRAILEKGYGKYCSHKCAYLDKKGNINKCLVCGNKIYIIPSKLRLGLGKFCSNKCKNESLKNGELNKCKLCGNTYYRTRYYIDKNTHPYCSRKCYDEYSKEHGSWTKGKHLPQLTGKNHPNWQGGITPKNMILRKSLEYKFWREAVFKRDNYTCVFCGARNGNGKRVELEADHIKRFANYPELRFDVNNGRTLCKNCHRITKTWGIMNLKSIL
jgi:5-methylcytosine-specific restriction endonuclease McrA